MPRGPGKKENYSFDYSRFHGVGDEEDFEINRRDGEEVDEEETIPEDMIRQLPGELREAFRLMQVSRQTGDEKAQQRANELALAAVERGGPEMRQRFQEEVRRRMVEHPEAKEGLQDLLSQSNKGGGITGLENADEKLQGMSSSIESLHKSMKAGAESAAKQLEKLRQQQEALEGLQGPEDFARFMAQQGLTQEDLQKALSGDESVMRKMVEKAIEKMENPEEAESLKKVDDLLTAVDDLHTQLQFGDKPDRTAPRVAPRRAEAPEPRRREAEPAGPAPKIPEHRVQYQKDELGRLQGVELRCELPGVQSMDAIELDVSERHLRLRTLSPAYVVNVGPFPDLVEASAAKAKFSKKRQELTISVPAKL